MSISEMNLASFPSYVYVFSSIFIIAHLLYVIVARFTLLLHRYCEEGDAEEVLVGRGASGSWQTLLKMFGNRCNTRQKAV